MRGRMRRGQPAKPVRDVSAVTALREVLMNCSARTLALLLAVVIMCGQQGQAAVGKTPAAGAHPKAQPQAKAKQASGKPAPESTKPAAAAGVPARRAYSAVVWGLAGPALRVRIATARNPKCPPELLSRLAADHSDLVR